MSKYPDVHVKIDDEDEAIFLMGKVVRALRENGVSAVERNAFMDQVASESDILATCKTWVSIS